MSLIPQTAFDGARALVIAVAVLSIAAPLARLLAHSQGRRRQLAWVLLLTPLFTPALLVSYAYSRVALTLGAVPGALAGLHSVALLLKFTPIAALVLHFVPPALTLEASHCHALSTRSAWDRWVFRARGAGRAPWIAGGLVFLLAFADFELASLWTLKTWTVSLFDAQTGGLAFVESLRLAALPFAVELIALSVVAFCGRSVPPPHTPGGKAPNLWADAYLVLATIIATAIPLLLVLAQAFAGFRIVMENFVLGAGVLASLAFAAIATACAWTFATALERRRVAGIAVSIPGLLGGLLLSLLILALFQFPALRRIYDTPLPLLLTLTLLLMPLAVPLRWLLAARRNDPALYTAHLANAHEIAWRLDGRRRWLAVFLVFCAAYFDFTASSMLAPVGLTPAFVRLHNLAHYGRTGVLSAMLCAAVAAPVVVLLLTAPVARLYARRNGE